MLLPIITVISLFVLVLLLYVVARSIAAANPVPSQTTPQHADRSRLDGDSGADPGGHRGSLDHPAGAPVSRARPKDALTIKATGYQWYWGYTYPDNGEFRESSPTCWTRTMPIAEGEPAAAGGRQPHGRAGGCADPHPDHRRGRDPLLRRARRCGSSSTPCRAASTNACCRSRSPASITASAPNCAARATATCRSRSRRVPRDEFEQWVRSQGGTVGEDEAVPQAEPAADLRAAPSSVEDAAAAPARRRPKTPRRPPDSHRRFPFNDR